MSAGSGSSALLPYLPLLYVAWSDGSMDLAELRSICNRVVDVWKMSPEDRERFVRWLDPDQPPTVSELDEILALVRESSAGSERRGPPLAHRAGLGTGARRWRRALAARSGRRSRRSSTRSAATGRPRRASCWVIRRGSKIRRDEGDPVARRGGRHAPAHWHRWSDSGSRDGVVGGGGDGGRDRSSPARSPRCAAPRTARRRE